MEDYVAVGLAPEYSVTVSKSTFDKGFILFTVIFIASLIIFVTIVFIIAFNNSQPKKVPPIIVLKPKPPNNYSNFGAASYPQYPLQKKYKIDMDGTAFKNQSECLSNENTKWENGVCSCTGAFFGPRCKLEKHSSKYFSVGIIDESSAGLNILATTTSNGKSFNDGSCSTLCDDNALCSGFIYHHPNQCTLISGDVTIPKNSNISYSVDSNSTLYLKDIHNVKFDDTVFISSNQWALNGRYWLNPMTDTYAQIIPYNVTKINFYPTHIKINSSKTGIYCTHPFTSGDIPDILQHNNNMDCYIHYPNTPLRVPQVFNGVPLYVTYF